MTEDRKLEMKNANIYQQKEKYDIAYKNNTILCNSHETTNPWPMIAGRNWSKNNNDEDVQELDKSVEPIKIISLKTPGFLDVIT